MASFEDIFFANMGCGGGQNCFHWIPAHEMIQEIQKSAVKQRGRERKGWPEIIQNFFSQKVADFKCRCPYHSYGREQSTGLALFGRRILGQNPAAPSSRGPFVLLLKKRHKTPSKKRAQRLTFWVRRPPGGVGVFHSKGWWPKTSCLPSKVCLPWVSKRGIWDVPGIFTRYATTLNPKAGLILRQSARRQPVVQTQVVVVQDLLCGNSSQKAPYYRGKGPGVQGKRKKFVQKNFVRIFRSLTKRPRSIM